MNTQTDGWIKYQQYDTFASTPYFHEISSAGGFCQKNTVKVLKLKNFQFTNQKQNVTKSLFKFLCVGRDALRKKKIKFVNQMLRYSNTFSQFAIINCHLMLRWCNFFSRPPAMSCKCVTIPFIQWNLIKRSFCWSQLFVFFGVYPDMRNLI